MSSENGGRPATKKMGTSQVFADYCQDEFERRRNSGDTFDEETYKKAMDMALIKLGILEDEGLA